MVLTHLGKVAEQFVHSLLLLHHCQRLPAVVKSAALVQQGACAVPCAEIEGETPSQRNRTHTEGAKARGCRLCASTNARTRTHKGKGKRGAPHLGESYHFVGHAPELLRLLERGLDPLVLDELRDHVAQHRPSVRARAAQIA
jgi:hypothetical protein